MTGDQVKVSVGATGLVEGHGSQLFMVLSVSDTTLRVREWPFREVPMAQEILRSEFHTEGDRE